MVFIGWKYFCVVHGIEIPIHDYVECEGKLESIIHENGTEEYVNEGKIKRKPFIKGEGR
ncbi:hypothetical protein Q7A53_02080 [Halobacillus rhizosphaerae]|uniref:hypothetical protein n=1 Tax=Halobacillus rhizosphaerae TaxID=3064889 RepID=UPI00398B7EB3